MADPPRPATVLVVGIGEVGGYLLEFLARDEHDLRIVAGDVDLAAVTAKAENARFGAALQGREPELEARAVDLFDLDRTAELIAELGPAVVVNGAVLQTWHVIRQLPEDLYARLSSAGLGAWLPVQLTLAMRLAQAIESSGIRPRYVNTSLSDLTNPALAAMGLAPDVGIGNVALIETAVRSLAARRLGLARDEVKVTLVAHHVHWVLWREAGYREGAPFFLRIEADGRDLTDHFDPVALLKEAILLYPGGTSFSAVSASSAIANVRALLSDEPVRLHSPGPNGLPGGYPLRISRSGVEVDLPADLPLDDAIALNLEAQTYDGVQRIDDDGRVHFMPYAVEILRDLLGFACESFTPGECEELAREQITRFRRLLESVAG